MKTLIKIFLLLLFSIASTAGIYAQRTVTGTVADKNGDPIPGVNVIVTGTTLGTITDITGKYSIEVPQGANSLTFSFIGMDPQEITIGTLTQINVTMAESAIGLEEVVVVGYGSQRKRNVTAAISTIDVSTLKDIPVASVSRLLEGQTTGVTVKQTTGAPGKEFEVTIRGLGSLGAGSQPLYVVDGFPVGTSVGQNLNPNDIATITILKDAVSTAIYGARGSNGVMLITTKKAKAGEVNLSVTANYGIQNVPESRKLKVLNGVQFAEFKKESFMDKIRNLEHREP